MVNFEKHFYEKTILRKNSSAAFLHLYLLVEDARMKERKISTHKYICTTKEENACQELAFFPVPVLNQVNNFTVIIFRNLP